MRNNSELTIIIPFKNEGDELFRTLKSIRDTAGETVAIVVVNDFSDDGYDYGTAVKPYNVRCIELYKSIGPARARDLGVRACETEYFVLMDAHMRLYQKNWPEKILRNLKQNPNSIICSATNDISNPDTDETYSGGAYGAFVYFEPGFEYTIKWLDSEPSSLPEFEEVREVICVLGAFYASTKTHWKNINGLAGLDGFGFEEPWISLKTWLAGGKCLNLKGFTTGHLYRRIPPAKIAYEKYYANQILLNFFFTKDEDLRKKYDNNLKRQIGSEMYQKARQEFNSRRPEIENFRTDFYQKIAKVPMEDFLSKNQSVAGLPKNREM